MGETQAERRGCDSWREILIIREGEGERLSPACLKAGGNHLRFTREQLATLDKINRLDTTLNHNRMSSTF